ncbi:MAG: polyketide synthase, partial [Myxococcota bacterium]
MTSEPGAFEPGAFEAGAFEPIAIVAAACRLPGDVSDPDALWDALCAGRRLTGPPPPDREDGAPASGGFLTAIGRFDAQRFGLAPAEARLMDPQHRLLLEAAWELCERSGRAPDRTDGAAIGVWLGIALSDYARRSFLGDDPAGWTALAGTGSLASLAAGRIAHRFGWTGPAIGVDTACSSGLVAVHLACRALADRECAFALAGASNLVLHPAATAVFADLGVLSPSGVCRPFAPDADGYVRGEGVVWFGLERLADARVAGHDVLAVIRGSALGHDGRTTTLTAPSGRAQQAVIRAALRRAGVEPDAIGLVETHGTGTRLGDAVEAGALRAVFGDRGLQIGALKANLGHLEAAAGAAGLLKAALAVSRGVVPPELGAAARAAP